MTSLGDGAFFLELRNPVPVQAEIHQHEFGVLGRLGGPRGHQGLVVELDRPANDFERRSATGSLDFWSARLEKYRVPVGVLEHRFGDRNIGFDHRVTHLVNPIERSDECLLRLLNFGLGDLSFLVEFAASNDLGAQIGLLALILREQGPIFGKRFSHFSQRIRRAGWIAAAHAKRLILFDGNETGGGNRQNDCAEQNPA